MNGQRMPVTMKVVLILILMVCGNLFSQNDASGFPAAWFWPKYFDPFTGKPSPTLQLKDAAGLPLTGLQQKILVLDFSCSWCSYCRERVALNNALQKKYALRGILVVGVLTSSNAVHELPHWLRELGLRYPAGTDPNRDNLRLWDAKFFPTYTVVDRSGIVRAAGLRPEYAEDFLDEYLRREQASSNRITPAVTEAERRAPKR
ncbi:MAG: TlpA family protein disulfide reductase [Spirochaetia bacterium]|nr:TlpA family protein disulfide reductase [Spirochaetia bacterium]